MTAEADLRAKLRGDRLGRAVLAGYDAAFAGDDQYMGSRLKQLIPLFQGHNRDGETIRPTTDAHRRAVAAYNKFLSG